MAAPRPVTPTDITGFDEVIDARSPAEFAIDHVPGAINCPVLDDEERRIVGTLYNQSGAFEARRVGGAMVAANLAKHLRERFADKPRRWRPLVYCWRGGLRSGSMVTWMRLVGWEARQLAGGYKSYRKYVIATIDSIAPALELIVLAGPTGSAKTRILHALDACGQQVLDLEAFAGHKGSVLGGIPGVEQPSQKGFETRLGNALQDIDVARPVFIEAESRKIGRISVPTTLLDRLRGARCIEVVPDIETRLSYLLRDYAYLGDDPAKLATSIGQLHELHPRRTIERWQSLATSRQLDVLFRELMTEHYDRLYARSQSAHLANWSNAERLQAHDLSDGAIREISARIVERLPHVMSTQRPAAAGKTSCSTREGTEVPLPSAR